MDEQGIGILYEHLRFFDGIPIDEQGIGTLFEHLLFDSISVDEQSIGILFEHLWFFNSIPIDVEMIYTWTPLSVYGHGTVTAYRPDHIEPEISFSARNCWSINFVPAVWPAWDVMPRYA